jgi:hypothetical protein
VVRRWRGLIARRGRFFYAPPRYIPLPPYPPAQFIRQHFRGRAFPQQPRGHFWYAPPRYIPLHVLPPPLIQPARSYRVPPPRRGRYFDIPWHSQVAAVSYWTPPVLQPCRSQRIPSPRRGRFFEPPWTKVTPEVPQYIRQHAARRLPAPSPRRGHFLEPPWKSVPPATGLPPPYLRQAATRHRSGPARRGRYFELFRPQGSHGQVCPAVIRQPSSRWTTRPPRRGRFVEPFWPQGVIVAVPLSDPLLGGTITQIPYGGTVTQPAYGGSVAVALSGGTVTTIPYAGTITGGIVGVQSDIQAIVNNDVYLYLTITYNGAPLNLTGYTLKAYLKATRTTPDSEATVFTTSSGLTVTDAATGSVTWDIPHADLPDATNLWYRFDVIDASSEVFTSLYGNFTVLPA